jgi:3-oxoacyl-[acyl-carrier protein] reductase
MELRGAVIVITGASRGIGKATALTLAKERASLVLNSKSSIDELQRVAESVKAIGGQVLTVPGDVGVFTDCEKIVAKTLERFGAIDVLINNAGVFSLKPLVQMQPEDWESMFRIHVFGAFNMIRCTLPYMLERKRGVIVNVSSFVALRPPGPGRTHYAAAKAALIGLTKSLNLEVVPYGIRVVGVAPGLTKTEMALRGILNLEERVRSIPMGRIGQPEEIAHAIKFLIENDFISGETIVVSGGE